MQVQLTTEERNWAMAAHLSALVAIAGIPFGHVVGPLVVYLVKGSESEFVGEHARASLNYQITISIAAIIAIIVAVIAFFGFIVTAAPIHSGTDSTVGVGIFALWAAVAIAVLLVLLVSIVFIVFGTIAASEGRPYTYPFAIRFLR